MSIDWELLGKLGIPALATLLVALLKQATEHRPRLIAYFSSVSAFPFQATPTTAVATLPPAPSPPPGQPATTPTEPKGVNTHTIVIRNAGKKTAFNVRLGHWTRPLTYQLTVKHDVTFDPAGPWEIVIPTLVPREQVQVSYLYLPPLTVGQINSYIKSDESNAQITRVLPTPQPHPAVKAVLYALLYLGLGTFVYLILLAGRWVYTINSLVRP